VADVSRRQVPFWLRPRWLVGHVLVVALVATFVSLGLWQLRRHDDRRERNAEIAARAEVPTAPVEEVVPPGAGIDDVEALRFRRVVLVGTYDTGGEVLIRPRSQDGVSGWDVVTPLVLRDGRAVLVDRGFAPLAPEPSTARAAAVPPSGPVTVTGLVLPSQVRRGIGPTDPEDGTLAELARVDIARIQQQYGRELLPVHVQLETQDPPQGERQLPQVLPTPATDDGPHLSYAVQWFLFAGVGLIGWPVLLQRTGREERRPGRRPDPAVAVAPGPGAGAGSEEERPVTGSGGGSPGGGGSTARPGRPVGTGHG
jgi:cytochrome oxidase assembly protein ShyY1